MRKVEKFEELIKDYIGRNKIVVEIKWAKLTAPGENYMSDIVKIHTILRNQQTGVLENLHLVAKLVPEQETMGPTTFLARNEILFYTDIVPSIKRFHERRGLPYPKYFTQFIGSRINLTGSNEPDKNAVLLLQNLKESGYENCDRHIGYDFETAKLVLEDLASFHAAPLAMKLIESEIFETEVEAKCRAMKLPIETPRSNSQSDTVAPINHTTMPRIFNILLEILNYDEKFSEIVIKYENFVGKIEATITNKSGDCFNKTPFVTLTHQDMWMNNAMQIVKDGRSIKNKIIDFQMLRFGSPAVDIIFFLFSSVQLACLEGNLDNLLKHYHNSFAKILQRCDCYGSQYSYNAFLEELKSEGRPGIEKSILMIPTLIFAKKGEAYDMTREQTMTIEDVPSAAKNKLIFLCLEASKRSWF